jgi:hypothetical protein
MRKFPLDTSYLRGRFRPGSPKCPPKRLCAELYVTRRCFGFGVAHDRPHVCMRVEPPGSFDNGYAGTAGAWTASDGRIYGFDHSEDHEDMPPLADGYIPGFNATIVLAISDDGGMTWKKQGPVITSNKHKSYSAFPGQAFKDVGVPGFVLDPKGEYLYAYYNEMSDIAGRGVQVCVARSPRHAGLQQRHLRSLFERRTPVVGSRACDPRTGLALRGRPSFVAADSRLGRRQQPRRLAPLRAHACIRSSTPGPRSSPTRRSASALPARRTRSDRRRLRKS